tara:strand:+ start:1830 stop:4097 length:2268 start_codon:yes stop_codon:yes gene_type:complete
MRNLCHLILSLLLIVLVNGRLSSQNLKQINLSHQPGFFSEPFYLKATSDHGDVNCKIDGKDFIFPDSLFIEKNKNISFYLKNDTSLIDLGSYSYFIDFKSDFKVISITIDEDHLYSYSRGIYVNGPGAYFDTVSKHYRNTNFSKKWERENFIEIFDEDGIRIINQYSGIRIFGGMTKYYPEKSLRIIARSSYGLSRFNADLFGHGKKKYKQFIIRHSGNDYRGSRFKDAFTTTLSSESGLDVQKSSPAHLFINSEYWGVYNIREKINKYYINNNYNTGISGINILQGYKTAEEGDNKEYVELLNYVKNNDLSLKEHYNFVKNKMDVRSFMNFWIHQIFYANHDARGNIRFWKSDSLDNKFRWIVYDTDLGFGPNRVSKDLLKDFTSKYMTDWYNPNWATLLLRNLLENNDFKKDFINQSSFILSSTLSPENILERIDEFEELYKNEMEIHFSQRKKFQSYQGNYKNWLISVEKLRVFARKRAYYSFNHLEKKFDLEKSCVIKINVNSSNKGSVFLNNNKINSNFFIGKFYCDVPIHIVPKNGYSYSGFVDSVINLKDDTVELTINFIQNLESNHKIVLNEVDYINDCLEIFNYGDTTIDLNGWKLVDNKNELIINDFIVNGNNLGVFHFIENIEKNDTIEYKKINFKFSSQNEIIYLYDNMNKLVDSVRYKLDSLKKTYSRNIPFESLNGIVSEWNNSDTSSIGNHNPFYQRLSFKMNKKIQEQKFRKKIFIYSSSIISFLALIFFLIKRRNFNE